MKINAVWNVDLCAKWKKLLKSNGSIGDGGGGGGGGDGGGGADSDSGRMFFVAAYYFV